MSTLREWIGLFPKVYREAREDCGRGRAVVLTLSIVLIAVPISGHPNVKNGLGEVYEGDE